MIETDSVAPTGQFSFLFGPRREGLGLVFGHFHRGTNVKPEVDAWIAAQRLNRLAQALQPWVDVKKGLALKEATDAQACRLAI